MKKRKIALDADYLVFMCTEGKHIKENTFDNEKVKLKPFKEKFKMLVQEVEDEIAANFPGEIKGIKVILSDSNSNFRYDMYPEYKGERPPRSELFYRLRTWAEKKYGYVVNLEADDIVAFLVREKNYFGASMDKDLLLGVPGDWFNVHHMHRSFSYTSEKQARDFNLIQTLMGDSTDNIKALPKKLGDPMIDGIPTPGIRKPFKVTEKLAMELLDNFGWNWGGVVKSFESKGFGEKEALLNRRLIGMDQWTPKKGVVLWDNKS